MLVKLVMEKQYFKIMKKYPQHLDRYIDDFFFDLYKETKDHSIRFSLFGSSFTTRGDIYTFRNIDTLDIMVIRVRDKNWPLKEYDIIGHNEKANQLAIPVIKKYIKDLYEYHTTKEE